MANSISDADAIRRIKASLIKNPRLHTLICAAVMEMAAEQITKEAVEEDRTAD